MQEMEIATWSELQGWLANYEDGQKQFAFRGQADSEWPLQTSLARHFLANHVNEHEWRKRELKMYCRFRERLLETCRGMHREWRPLDILSLMQHHGASTRLLDFTYNPKVAAYFALEDSRGGCAIWVVEKKCLAKRRRDMRLREYCGPEHHPEYRAFCKDKASRYRLVGSILDPTHTNERLAAQDGCFLVPGAISRIVSEELVRAKITLSKELVLESLTHLQEQGYCRERLFPSLEQMAREAKRFSVTGSGNCP